MKCLAIFNQEQIIKSVGMSDFPTADVAELSGAEDELSASKEYIQLKSHSLKNPENISASNNDVLTAYVKLKNRQNWIALTNQHCFENQN